MNEELINSSYVEKETTKKIIKGKIEKLLSGMAEGTLEMIKFKGRVFMVLGTGGAIFNMATLENGGNSKAALAAMLLAITGFLGSSIISEEQKKRGK